MNGRRTRILNIMDEYSREALTVYSDYSVPGISMINQREFPVKEARKLYRICTSCLIHLLGVLRWQYLLCNKNIFIFVGTILDF